MTKKIIVVGNYIVGKTALVNRICKPEIPLDEDNYEPSLGLNIENYYDESEIKYNFWDIPGSEPYSSYISGSSQNASVALLCFDTLGEHNIKWLNKQIPEIKKQTPNCQFILVQTQIDHETVNIQDNNEDLQKLKQKFSINHFVKTSAKTDEGREDLLVTIAKMIKEQEKVANHEPIILNEHTNHYFTLQFACSFVKGTSYSLIIISIVAFAMAIMITSSPAIWVTGGALASAIAFTYVSNRFFKALEEKPPKAQGIRCKEVDINHSTQTIAEEPRVDNEYGN